MFVCILNPVPVVILVSPFLKQEFAKNEAWASPATPIIGILLLKLPSKSLSPNNSELFLILGNLFSQSAYLGKERYYGKRNS